MESTPKLVADKYCITSKLGVGGFGSVYKGYDIYTRKKVAIKLENSAATGPSIAAEARTLKDLADTKGFPSLFCNGIYKNQHFLILELLGLSLKKVLKRRGRLSLKSVIMTGLQLLERLEVLHKHGLLHRDIKPDNCVLGRTNNCLIYLIDFGLSKKYINNGMHLPYREGKPLTGTARYASVNIHLGIESSRRDDLESLGYMLVALYYGQLPWHHISSKRVKNAIQRICQIKMGGSLHRVCPDLPPQIDLWVNYARSLGFKTEPDYKYLQKLLQSIADSQKLYIDNVFDWVKKRSKSRKGTETERLETEEGQDFPEFKHPEETIKVFKQLKKKLSTRQSTMNSMSKGM